MLFSVIVPVYNAQAHLNECIDSILSQSYCDFELILVDDGSVDFSLNICKSYANSDDRIIIIHKENEGVSLARQRGVEIARGKYLCFVDSDDKIANNYLDAFFNIIRKYNPSVICTGIIKFDGQNEKQFKVAVQSGLYDKNKIVEKIYPLLICNAYNKAFSDSVCCKAIDKSLFKENQLQGVGVTIGEDGACIKPCLFNAKSIYVLDECMYYYRIWNDSATKKRKVRSWNEPMIIEKHLRSKIDTSFGDLNEQIYRSTVHALFNTAVSRFNKTSKKLDIIFDIKKGLNLDFYKEAIENANFMSLKGKIASFSLKHKCILLIYLRWVQINKKII